MSKLDDDWSVDTPPSRHTPKRQKTNDEIKIKISYPKTPSREDHVLHIMLLQVILSTNDTNIKVINKRGEALKESTMVDLTNEAFHKNHFNLKYKYTGNRDDRQSKVVIIHRIRGITSERNLKKDRKVMQFLRQHSIQLTSHEWTEDDWDTKVIGFFTQVFPSCMNAEYATKIVNQSLKNTTKRVKAPLFRLQTIPMKAIEGQSHYRTRVFGLEVKSQEVKAMMESIKSSVAPGGFVPFQLRRTNEPAYHKALKYVASKNENTWKILINYVSEGAFFKLEGALKESLHVQHITHNPINHTMTVLVPKSQFDQVRAQLKVELQNLSVTLDPEDTRLFDTNPEVAYLARDDMSSSRDSYSSRSISSIMSFEIEEVTILPHLDVTPIPTPATPSEVSEPSTVTATSEVETLRSEIRRYQDEMLQYVNKMDRFQTLLETILLQVGNLAPPSFNLPSDNPESHEGRHRERE